MRDPLGSKGGGAKRVRSFSPPGGPQHPAPPVKLESRQVTAWSKAARCELPLFATLLDLALVAIDAN